MPRIPEFRPDDLGSPMEKNQRLSQFEHLLGYAFTNGELLETSLIHSSFSHEKLNLISNERLEFLGDSVLQLLVTQKIYQDFPKEEEGILSKLRSSIVNEKTLAELSHYLKLDDFLLVGSGEKKILKDSLKANTFEAILGAVYLDGGLSNAELVWKRAVENSQVNLFDLNRLLEFDAKSKLQEFCLMKWKNLPSYLGNSYNVGKETFFRVSLSIEGYPLISTFGPSKKKSESLLAEICLKQNLHKMIERGHYAK